MKYTLLCLILLWAGCSVSRPATSGGEEAFLEADSKERASKTSATKIRNGSNKEYSRRIDFENNQTSVFFENEHSVAIDVIKAGVAKTKIKTVESIATQGKKVFTLQFEVVADFDEAKKRQWSVAKKTGLGTYLLFDSPFYKIRGGKWQDENEVEDAAIQYNAMGISAIIIPLN